jgi:hypothetical protein
MAQYVRFEIYIPVVYTLQKKIEKADELRNIRHALDDELLREFISSAIDEYHGLTQANPLAPALYRGWWQAKPGASIAVDYLTYLFGLVRIDEFEEAKTFFAGWKQRFEEATEQITILLIYYSVQTVGDFL